MNGPGSPAWIFMPFLILLVFGAIAAIIWRSWVVGAIVLVLILLAGGVVITYRVSEAPRTVVTIEQRGGTLDDEPEGNVEILKTADVYPSLTEAARFAAIRIHDSIQLAQPPLVVKRIRILSNDKQDMRPIIAQVLRDRYPRSLIVADDSHASENFEMTINVTLSGDRGSQCLDVAAAQEGRNFHATTCVKEARWFSNIDGYRAENPSSDWVLGRSADVELSHELARHQAREDAARKMVPFVIAKFPELNRDQRWLQTRLEQELEHREFIKDDFIQRLRMPVTGTTTYRAGVLVDAGSLALEQLHNSIIPEFRHRNSRVHRFGGGLVGMGVLICLLYLFLNRATRGYFQMNLRLAATMALVAGVLLILLITS